MLTRTEQLALIWRHTHPDYKGTAATGRALLLYRPGQGSCLVALDSLSAAEIASKLPYALRCEAKRQKGKRLLPSEKPRGADFRIIPGWEEPQWQTR